MDDQITTRDFCLLCGCLLSPSEDVTCTECDKEVMGIMANGMKARRARGVKQLSPSGKIKRYFSMQNASEETGIAISSISRACGGTLKSAGGFTWSYS